MARGKKKEKILTPEEKLQQALVPESEQPYQVPENWRWVYLTSGFAECLDSYRKPINANERANRTGDIPYYGSTGQVGWIDDYLTDEELVLLGEDGAPFLDLIKDKAYIISGKAWVNNHAHILRSIFGHIGNLYLLYYLNIFNFSGYVNGTTRLKLTQASMNTIPVPLPSLPEQQRIVDRIESLFAKLDEAKEKAQAVVDGFEDRKAAILHKAFTGELTEGWRERNNKNESGPFNKKLSELCIKITDGTHHSPPNNSTGRYMYITAKNIKESGIDLSDISFVSQSIHEEIYSRCDVQYGDVLYIKDGATTGIATVNQLREQFSLLSSVAVLRVNSMLNNEYLAFALNSRDIKQAMLEKMAGVAITRLTLAKIKASEIPVFSIEEQYQIVKILKSIIEKEQKAKECAEQVIDQIDAMKKSILARAFRGDLGTNNPSDESAEERLKRIL